MSRPFAEQLSCELEGAHFCWNRRDVVGRLRIACPDPAHISVKQMVDVFHSLLVIVSPSGYVRKHILL